MKNKRKRFKLLLSGLLIFIFAGVHGQDSAVYIPKYSFVRYDLNKIDFPGDSTPFYAFLGKYDKLIRTNTGNINIVHFGGSHVQADMWTSRIRQNFNGTVKYPLESRGIIFPYKAVKTNGSLQFDIEFNTRWEGLRNVKLTEPDAMGLMGWKATARDSGQYIDVTLKGDSATLFCFDKLRIFHEYGGFYFPFTVEICDSVYTPVYIDSCKCSEIIPAEINNHFRITVHRTDTLQQEFVLYGIQTLFSDPGISYHSVGVNGASVPSYLNSKYLEDQIRYLNPDLIIFAIGINDSFDKTFSATDFEANYNELIRRIRSVCPDVAFLFITNTDSYRKVRRSFYKNLNGKVVRSSMYRLGGENNAAVWDLYSVMGGLSSISQWKRNGLAQRDLIHLTRAGYELAGDLFFEAIMERYSILKSQAQP